MLKRKMSLALLMAACLSYGQWTEIPIPDSVTLSSIYFADSLNGWMVGTMGKADNVKTGVILNSTDGGNHWNVQQRGEVGSTYTALSFINRDTGWVVGRLVSGTIVPLMLKTVDAGRTWTSLQSPSIDSMGSSILSDVSFRSALSGWAISDKIFHTMDGGATWTQQPRPQLISNTSLISIAFANNEAGWIVGWSGQVLRTEDAGETWSGVRDTLGGFNNLKSVCFVDQNHGWVAGNMLYKTSDGGDTWEKASTELISYPGAVAFADTNNGWAVGKGIQRTENGGQDWVSQLDSTAFGFGGLRKICVANERFAWAIGSNYLQTSGGWSIKSLLYLTVNGGGKTIAESPTDAQEEVLGLESVPNPFNPSTTIRVRGIGQGFGALRIFNTSGQMVFERSVTGKEVISWNAKSCASGIYTAVLTQENRRVSSRLFLVK